MAPVFKCSRLWSRLPHSTKKRIKRTRRHSRTRMTSSLRVCYQEVTDLFFHVWYSSSRTQTHDVTMWSQCHVLNDYAKDMLCVTPHKPFIRGFAFDWTVNSKLHRYFCWKWKTDCFKRELIRTVWPSGLRRWLQAPVRKGVGSNPTAVICTMKRSFLVLMQKFFKLWFAGWHHEIFLSRANNAKQFKCNLLCSQS